MNLKSSESDKITRQEFRQILKSFDKEGFGNIMNEYVKEISDPNNVVEMNQYLKQAEENKDLPKNVKLALPTIGFCIKSEKFSIKRPGTRQIVYINICSLINVKPPQEEKPGMWSLPHLLNKSRNDQNKKGIMCIIYDVIFNPLAIQLGRENINFKKFICETSINGINNNILKASQEKISADYVLKTKLDYKGKEVSYINIHSLNAGELDSRAESNEDYKTVMQKEIDSMKTKNKKDEDDECNANVFEKTDMSVEQSEKDIQREKKFPLNPIYKIKYSDKFELHKFFYTPNSNIDGPQYKNLVIEIEVPLLENLNNAELELDTRKLNFKYKEIYLLSIDLPVDINKNTSDAKFDRNKNLLIISASIVRRNKEWLICKEDENIEIIKDETDQIVIEETIRITKEETIEITKKENCNTTSKLMTSEDINDNDPSNSIAVTITSEDSSSDKYLPKNENMKLEESPLLIKEENKNSNISENKIIEIIKDEDDVIQSKELPYTREELIKISYINFFCEFVYELD